LNKKPGGISIAALAAATTVGIAAGMALHTFDYAEGTSYLSNDPEACVNCHIMRDEYDGWRHGSHHAAAVCNDCHVPHDVLGKYATKVEHGYRHSKGFTFQDFHEPIQIKPSSMRVVENNCIRCHGELVSMIRQSGFGGHGSGINEAGAGEYTRCVHCHSHVGHGPLK
jgi:cytochrome c nitrite reductase small subunit